MFPNDLDKIRYPLNTRFWGVFIGTLVMVATPLWLVSPGTLQITTPIVFAGILYAAYARGVLLDLVPPVTQGTRVALALLSYLMISALWSTNPSASLSWASGAAVVAFTCGIAVRAMLIEPRRTNLHIAEGLWVGYLAGLVYLAAELLSQQSIKIFLYNLLDLQPQQLKPVHHFFWKDGKIVGIMEADLTRSITPVPLLLWCCLLAIKGTLLGRTAAFWSWLTFLFSAGVILISPNETAKLALICAAVSFAIALYNTKLSYRLLQVAWVVACILIVPITLGLYRANLHNAPWLQPSAKHRIIIWNRFTEETMKQPWIGLGTGMAYWNYETNKELSEGESYTRYSRDVHCVYLQVWFELGVIGAILFTLFGLALLQRLQRLPVQAVAYAHAAFAAAGVTLGSSYGLWRPWFNLTFAFTVVAFALALRAVMRKESLGLTRGPSAS